MILPMRETNWFLISFVSTGSFQINQQNRV